VPTSATSALCGIPVTKHHHANGDTAMIMTSKTGRRFVSVTASLVLLGLVGGVVAGAMTGL